MIKCLIKNHTRVLSEAEIGDKGYKKTRYATLSLFDFLKGIQDFFQYETMHENITFLVTSYNYTQLVSFIIFYSPRNVSYEKFGFVE